MRYHSVARSEAMLRRWEKWRAETSFRDKLVQTVARRRRWLEIAENALRSYDEVWPEEPPQ